MIGTMSPGLAAVHKAPVIRWEGVAAMHAAAIIPNNEVTESPTVAVGKFLLRGVCPDLVKQVVTFVDRHTDDTRP